MNDNEVEFMQFLRPDGRRKQVYIEVGAEVKAMADKLLAAGCRFEIEVLSTGHVSMEVVRPEACDEDDYAPLASELVSNGPGVVGAVCRMIRRAAEVPE